MKAVILAGGKGTRLRPYTHVVPKPLLPYKDKPIIEHIIEYLRGHDVTEAYISTGHLGHLIRNYFENRDDLGVKLHFVEETQPLGTAGCLSPLRDILDETFLIVGGDNLTDLNLGDLVDFHKSKKSILTPALFQEQHQIPWGVYELDDEGAIKTFVEKPIHRYNAGTMIFVAEPELFAYIPKNPTEAINLTDHVIPQLLRDKKRVHGYTFKDKWIDIGTVDQYHQLNGFDDNE
ncbi:MAG: Phosphoglucomutase/phosphomannomutase [Parcubacteria group bacterium GW2011_GWA2_47_8]|nr:MAG: Phosphoglucomutase/phosphomannomutase [Parcubacteria group bacterium GW2011_GWA2_47_8]OGX28225.1 MAG: hypothetical protein A3D10_05655 [Omnitrophica WOR_2 bacterium RIFCSPHIGHO2_02_FULL_48_11]OHB18422.1 MAG: hypothetical protein A2666_05035 [Parcubacteria group bacterium RIFCSPHIGHO2_01_FULL_47_10b]